ncbi:GNAT family N-acetyltransferase [Fodinibacter luteus]|uniref:GNAT family N-acetyltransferase n=1 Tax=Fodinibacter luteus TaxID=552064 RepID=A0ABP8KMR0_9MICO
MDSDATPRVREAVPTDAFAVAALHLQAEREWGQHVPPRYLDTFADAWLRDRARCTLLAEDGRHTPLGTIHGTVVHELPTPRRRPADAWMHLGFLYVTEAARGRGVGEALVRAMVGWCGEHDVRRMQVEAADEARELYEQVGFAQPDDGLLELRLSRSPR